MTPFLEMIVVSVFCKRIKRVGCVFKIIGGVFRLMVERVCLSKYVCDNKSSSKGECGRKEGREREYGEEGGYFNPPPPSYKYGEVSALKSY